MSLEVPKKVKIGPGWGKKKKKKVKIELPYDLAIALLGIYPKDTNVVIQRGTCTPMFIAAMSTRAKLWKDPIYSSTDKWIKMCVYTHTHKHTHTQWTTTQPSKKKEILPFAVTWLELQGIMLSKISQSEKDNYHMISLICGT